MHKWLLMQKMEPTSGPKFQGAQQEHIGLAGFIYEAALDCNLTVLEFRNTQRKNYGT
jgi:hypothetical protein